MEVPFAQALAAARRTVLGSGTVIWNLAPVPEKMTGAMMKELLAVTDYLLVNEHEAADAAAAIGRGTPDYAAAATDLAKAGDLTCIVTAGAKGALAVTADGSGLCAHAPRIAPVDTTGAGDTFVGAFTAMLHEKVALQSALEIGCEAAAQSCLKLGAQDGMPVRGAIKVNCLKIQWRVQQGAFGPSQSCGILRLRPTACTTNILKLKASIGCGSPQHRCVVPFNSFSESNEIGAATSGSYSVRAVPFAGVPGILAKVDFR
jgi:ribokinase